MRVLEVCPYDMARPGGVQNHIRDLAGWLRSQGHAVRIVAPHPLKAGAAAEGIFHLGRARLIKVHGTVTEIAFTARRELASLEEELRSFRPDILHLHTPWTPFLPFQVWRRANLPTVATFHATLPEGNGLLSRALRAAGGYFLRRVEAAVVPSASALASLAGLPGKAPLVLPPAIDLSGWSAAGREAAEDGSGAFKLVFLGRLEQRKGVDVLLRAWKRLAGALPEASLLIAGSGPLEPLVLDAVREGGGRVSHLPQPSDEAARRLVAEADLLIAPSLYGESFGIVLIEAMAAGTVPVAAANEGYRTVMTGAGSALLVPPGDAGALAETVGHLARDRAALYRLRRWGEAHAAGFDVAAVGPQFLALFSEALERRAWST